MDYSLEDKRKILDSAKGRFFYAEFVKKDGSVRPITCKKYIESYLHGKPGQNKSTVAHIPEYYVVAEMSKQGYRTINLKTLKMCKIDGKIYKFEEE